MSKQDRQFHFWAIVGVLLTLLLLALISGCVTQEPGETPDVIIGDFFILEVKFKSGSVTGDWYLVTLDPGTEIKIKSTWENLPMAGTTMRLIKRAYYYTLEKIKEEE